MWIIYSSSLEEEDVEGAHDCEAECCDILQDVPYQERVSVKARRNTAESYLSKELVGGIQLVDVLHNPQYSILFLLS